ncbi:MAG: hypothetical protein FD167_305 [bacterium]|nr:MAG: hypothetical protein FD167_305 [bacterium]
MLNRKSSKSFFIVSFLIALIFSFAINKTKAANPEQVKIVTVTVDAKNKASLPQLERQDFLVSEKGKQQEVLSVVPASKYSPLNLAVVIQEGSPQVNSEIGALREFVTSLPAGSQVMVNYVNGNFVQTAQGFTTDLNQATRKIHVVSTVSSMPSSPYVTLIDVMKQFNGKEIGRNQILFISSGVDSLNSGFSPASNLYLERAIKTAQQENISISTLFTPRIGRRGSFIGQNNLTYLAEGTGGIAFVSGTSGYVTFDAPLKQYRQMLDNQYVITYRSTNADKGFRSIKVTTDFSNIRVTSQKGYIAKI